MASPAKPSSVNSEAYRSLPAVLLFGLAVMGTALWAWIPWPPPQDPVFLKARQEIPGYRFQPIPLGQQVAETLATPDLLNGQFWDARSNRVSVFHASWQPGQGTGAVVFGHTPELCWVGAGFSTLHLGEPSQVSWGFSGGSIPFQCRILQHPVLAAPEITLWAACLDGHWDEIVYGSPPNMTEGPATLSAYLQESWRTVVTRGASVRRLLKRPLTQNARKQFVRFSHPVHHRLADRTGRSGALCPAVAGTPARAVVHHQPTLRSIRGRGGPR
jgi:hypothetical protein